MDWNEPRWVVEDGVRIYFTERDRGGPSQLECYRRLLSEPETRSGSTGLLAASAAAVRWIVADRRQVQSTVLAGDEHSDL